jgi:hypothetical protein
MRGMPSSASHFPPFVVRYDIQGITDGPASGS